MKELYSYLERVGNYLFNLRYSSFKDEFDEREKRTRKFLDEKIDSN